MARYHGRNAKIYLQGSGAEAIPMVAMAEWSIDMTKDRVDATSFDDANIVEFAGHPKLAGKFSGYWDDTYDALWQAVDAQTSKKMYVYPASNAATKFWEGLAWVDASISGSVKDMVKVEGTFSAGGTWVRH